MSTTPNNGPSGASGDSVLTEAFLETIESRHTRRAYRRDLRGFFGHDDVTADEAAGVRPPEIRRHLDAMTRDGLAASTRRRRLAALKRLFDWLVDRGTVDVNPARAQRIRTNARAADARAGGSSTSESTDAGPDTLTRSETERLIRATESAGLAAERDRGLLLTILYGALRRSEAAALNAEHVRPLGRYWVIDLPAGDAWASAYIKVPDRVAAAIEEVVDAYAIDQGALWRSLSNRNRDARLTADAIYKVVRRTGERAGLEGVTVEKLRQTGLRLAAEAGATLQQVQTHARLQTAAAASRYAESATAGKRLRDSAVDFVELDV